MNDKILAEQIRQTAEALNRMTADAMSRGFTVLMETDDSGEQLYVHATKEDSDGTADQADQG